MSIVPIRTDEVFKRILHYFEEKRVYLDPDLSLIKLSEIVGTNTTYLSNAINQYSGCNLRTFINKYRINYAKQLLTTSNCNIKELHKRSGFASRSAFYVAFQRIAGTTPLGFLVTLNKKEVSLSIKEGQMLAITAAR